MKTNVRPKFYEDVTEEVFYLAEQAGANIAWRWAEAVLATVAELERRPFLGRLQGDLPFAGVRSWRVAEFSRWLVFYGVRDADLIFYRVRHGAVNLLKLDINS